MATTTPPGPPPIGVADRVRGWLASPQDQLTQLTELGDTVGDLVYWRHNGRSFLLVRKPEHAEHVLIGGSERYVKAAHYRLLAAVTGEGLLTNEGESWARQRHLMQPMFSKRHLNELAAHMAGAVDDFLASWERLPDGATLDAAEAMSEVALDVVGRALFGTALGPVAPRLRPAVSVGLGSAVAAARLQSLFTAPRWMVDLIGEVIFRAPALPPPLGRLRDAMRTIDAVVNEVIDARLASGDRRADDLLGLLLTATDEHGRPMSRRQVRDEVVTLVLAGHETTANGLAWMWHLLSCNPAARERLHEEVDSAVGAGPLTADAVDRLPWAQACFQEAMRLFPPAWILEREAVADDELDGYRIPKGTTVFVPVYGIHRDPRWWPEPERFDPTRFLGDRPPPRGAYLPFGAGRRICIGAGFARLEAALVTAAVASRWTLDTVAPERVRPDPTVTLRPKGGLAMRVARRA